MKKILLGLVALSAASFAAQGDSYLNVRFGGDLGARYTEYEYEKTSVFSGETDEFGGELALEGYRSITDNFDLGLGIAYQVHADRKDKNVDKTAGLVKTGGIEYNSIPVYLIAKYNFNLNSEVKPYLKANLGYSFNIKASDAKVDVADYPLNYKMDVEDGLYWALGGGMEYKNFTLDLMYAVTKAESKLKKGHVKKDNDYGRVVLSAGYKFNL